MYLCVLKNTGELDGIRDEWHELQQRSGNNAIYSSHQWLVSSYRTFHFTDQIYVITLRDDSGALICIAPLVIISERYRFTGLRKICFPRNNQNPANDFVIMKGLEGECIDAIMDHVCSFEAWSMIDLQMIHADGITSEVMRRYLARKDMPFGVKTNRISPYIVMDTAWDEFWNQRSAKFRKSIRNKINKVKKTDYAVEKRIFDEPDPDALEHMLRISSRSWKRSAGTDLMSQKNNWAFYNELCTYFGPSGNISLYFLKVDGVPAAFEFHVEDKQVVYPIRADYDEGFEQLSPGSILEYEIIKALFADGSIHEYNSCGHTYNYLMNWTSKTREFINYEIFKKSLLPQSMYHFEYTLLPRLREYPFYDSIKRVLRRR